MSNPSARSSSCRAVDATPNLFLFIFPFQDPLLAEFVFPAFHPVRLDGCLSVYHTHAGRGRQRLPSCSEHLSPPPTRPSCRPDQCGRHARRPSHAGASFCLSECSVSNWSKRLPSLSFALTYAPPPLLLSLANISPRSHSLALTWRGAPRPPALSHIDPFYAPSRPRSLMGWTYWWTR